MKRNHLAFLMAVMILLGCVFVIAPTAYAETPTDTPAETPTEAPTEAPAEEGADASALESIDIPDIFVVLLRKIIRFFKWLIPQVKPYMQ